MAFGEAFEYFLSEIKIKNNEEIKNRYKKITKRLNKTFRHDCDSDKRNCLRVGSYGRKSGIHAISDLDMLYIFPETLRNKYKHNQSYFLQQVRTALLVTYPTLNIRVNGQVVLVPFNSQHVEVVPTFEEKNGTFTYADNNQGGVWRTCNPRAEMAKFSDLNNQRNEKLRNLAKVIRSWKNKSGIKISGFLIDTTAYRFMQNNTYYDGKGFDCYLDMFIDYLEYIAALTPGEKLRAPGSQSWLEVPFKNSRKIGRTIKLCKEARNNPTYKKSFQTLKSVIGNKFPVPKVSKYEYTNTEEYIEDKFDFDIKYNLHIDCKVLQDGFMPRLLRDMYRKGFPLKTKNTLDFFAEPDKSLKDLDYEIKWKVTNRGDVAESKDCIRGQIIDDQGKGTRREKSSFFGEHVVECWAIHNGAVVATDIIKVEITQ